MNRPLASLLIVGIPLAMAACGKSEATVQNSKPEAPKEVVQQEVNAAPVAVEAVKPEEALKSEMPAVPETAPAPSPYAVTDPHTGLGDFGSGEPI